MTTSTTTNRFGKDGGLSSRAATSFLNYPGDVADTFDAGRPLGPNLLGELFLPVFATYDPDLDSTRVGLSFIAPPGVTAAGAR